MLYAPLTRTFTARKILEHRLHGPSGEDRWTFSRDRNCWVLCDGASESWAAAAWAEHLAKSIALLGPGGATVIRARKMMIRESSSIPDWIAEKASDLGSWATALWVKPSRSGAIINAAAVGDTCMLLLDDFDFLESFPLQDSADFSSSPDLIGDQGSVPGFVTRIFSIGGCRRPSLLMATDALAARCLGEPPSSSKNLFRFLFTCTAEDFSEWVENETLSRRMKEDDCTLIWLQ